VAIGFANGRPGSGKATDATAPTPAISVTSASDTNAQTAIPAPPLTDATSPTNSATAGPSRTDVPANPASALPSAQLNQANQLNQATTAAQTTAAGLTSLASVTGPTPSTPGPSTSASASDTAPTAPEATPSPLTVGVSPPAPIVVDPKANPVAAPPAPVNDQIAGLVNRFMIGSQTFKDGTHRAVIKLAPEHLGEVTVTLDVRAGGVTLDLIAGPQAISALKADLADLRDQLAQSGLRLDDVSLSQSGAASGGAGTPDGRERWLGNQSGPGPFATGSRATANPAPTAPTPLRAAESGRLDVLI
jgi:flagellar hook-length control protein FliK